jgi:LmbE family N-acetylglucosaminyl deacetylase
MMAETPMRILIVVAHPDDIEFGAGGSVAVWAQEGAQITYCIVTDGGAGSNKSGEDLAQLVKTRQAEQIAAAEVVGVHDVRFLGYKDGTLQHTLELRREITRLIREIRPYRVMITDPTMVFAGNF